MPKPKAYEPIDGQMFQFLQWDIYNREYDHLDYADSIEEKKYLLEEYAKMKVFPKVIKLPKKYHAKK